MRQEGQEWEGQNSGGTETLGDLWKGEGCGGEHGVSKMNTTGTFRSFHDRELSGRKAGNLKEVGLGWIHGGRKFLPNPSTTF